MPKLISHRYGKARVRVLKILRAEDRQSIKEIEVAAMLEGDYVAHRRGKTGVRVRYMLWAVTKTLLARTRMDVDGRDAGEWLFVGKFIKPLVYHPPGKASRSSDCGDSWTRDRGGNGLHRGKVTIGGDWEACLDYIHTEAVELSSQPDLFLHIHAATRRLLAVAQGRIKNRNSGAFHIRLHSRIL